MIYLTSDLHLGHRAILGMQSRPFEDVDEMNKVLINNLNSYVNKNDTLYILGDLCFRISVDEANAIINKLNGKKILIKGNHDKNYDKSLFVEIADFLEIHIDGISISLMHYPMLSWPKSHHGSVHLHGHMHNEAIYNEENRDAGILRYDVGVDANNYLPVSWQQIRAFFRL